MRILYLCQRAPYPPDRGDKIASYNAICHLSRSHDVTIATLIDSDEEAANVEHLRRQGYEVITARRSSMAARLRVTRALFTGTPLSLAHYASPSAPPSSTAGC